ncbi:MAG TPA: hypothetical protein VKV16_06095, partial [Solirubrobacteraceae bacterium]|nr:hypothetical protein [Solirubrobacteraceae bacterium]
GYLITERPKDEGVPQEISTALAEDDSGLEESSPPPLAALLASAPVDPFAKVTVPLLSDLHVKLLNRTTLKLSFHLSVEAKVRLLAKRRSKLVASTPMRTLRAGNRTLEIKLDPRRWPTKLDLQTHALAPLKTVSTLESGASTDSVSTSLRFPPTRRLLESGLTRTGLLP